MKNLKISLVLAAFGVMGATTFAKAEMDMPGMVKVQGQLVDTKCYGMGANMGKPAMNFGNDHMVPGKGGKMMTAANCATACANMGIPVGLVEGGKPGNQTYVLITPAGQLANYMALEARVEGQKVFDGGIIPSKIEVKKDGRWEEVQIATMM